MLPNFSSTIVNIVLICSPLHFIEINLSIPIHIVHPECPLQLLLRSASRGDVQSQHKLSEVYGAAPVSVESSENILAEFLCVAPRKDLRIHFNKLCLGQLPVRTVFQEPLVPVLKDEEVAERGGGCS